MLLHYSFNYFGQSRENRYRTIVFYTTFVVFLWIGITFASFNLLGKIPAVNVWLIISVSASLISAIIIFRIWVYGYIYVYNYIYILNIKFINVISIDQSSINVYILYTKNNNAANIMFSCCMDDCNVCGGGPILVRAHLSEVVVHRALCRRYGWCAWLCVGSFSYYI